MPQTLTGLRLLQFLSLLMEGEISSTCHHSTSATATQWSHLQTRGSREAPEAVLSWSSALGSLPGQQGGSGLEPGSASCLQALVPGLPYC